MATESTSIAPGGQQSTHVHARFNLGTRTLETGVSGAADRTPPPTQGQAVTDWNDSADVAFWSCAGTNRAIP
jgi:hypothetical protein